MLLTTRDTAAADTSIRCIPSRLVIALPADSASAAYTSQQILYIRQIVSRRRRENILADMDIQEFCYAMWADLETSKSVPLLNAVVNFPPLCLMLKHSKRIFMLGTVQLNEVFHIWLQL